MPRADEVRKYQEEHGCSLTEASRILSRQEKWQRARDCVSNLICNGYDDQITDALEAILVLISDIEPEN